MHWKTFVWIWTWYRTCLDQTGAKSKSIFSRWAFLLELQASIPYSDLRQVREIYMWCSRSFASDDHGCLSAKTFTARSRPVRFIPIWHEAQERCHVDQDAVRRHLTLLEKSFLRIWTWYRTCLYQTGAKSKSIFSRWAFLLELQASIPYSDLT